MTTYTSLWLSIFLLVSSAISIPTRAPKWTTLANITFAPRQEHTTVFLPPSTIAILGGVVPVPNTFPPPTTDIVQFYSIEKNTWETKAPLPVPLNHPNIAVNNGKIYVLGGLAESNGEMPPAWRAVPDSWVYDPATNAWTSIAPLPTGEERGSAAVGVYEGKIFLAGGMETLVIGEGGLQDTVDTVSIYDTATGQWIDVPEAAKNIPEARDHAGAAVVGNKFYILGGRDHGQLNVKDTVYILDLCNIEKGWSVSSAKMPTPRGGLAAGAIGTKIYTFGGEGDQDAESGVFNETEVYDVTRNSWKRLPPMEIARHGTSAVGVGNRVYIPGGGIRIGGAPVADFNAFSP